MIEPILYSFLSHVLLSISLGLVAISILFGEQIPSIDIPDILAPEEPMTSENLTCFTDFHASNDESSLIL